MTTTINDLKKALQEVRMLQSECVTDAGIVKSSCRNTYNVLTKEERKLRECIEYLQNFNK